MCVCVCCFLRGGWGFRACGYLEVHGADHLLLVIVLEVTCLRPVKWAICTYVVKAGYG